MNDKSRCNKKLRVWIRPGDPLVEREGPWGPWFLDKKHRTLDLIPPGYQTAVYSVDLDTCEGPLGSYKWVLHLAEKLGDAYWTAGSMGHFVWALRDLRTLPYSGAEAQTRSIAQPPHQP